MTDIEIPAPLRGLSENLAAEDQPPLTSPEVKNVRGIDPVTGRTRISQRSGLSKLTSTPLSGTQRIKEIVQLAADQNLVEYVRLSNGTEQLVFQKELPSQDDADFAGAEGIAQDAGGSVYLVDGGTGIVKYNGEGVELLKLSLPVQDESNRIRALHVDAGLDVYVGVSSGGDVRKARLWKYRPIPGNELEQVFEIETGRFVLRMTTFGGRLYTLQRDPLTVRTFLTVYRNIATSLPEVDVELEVGDPSNDIAVNSAGEVFVCSEPNATRFDAKGDQFSQRPVVHWTPEQLIDFENRVWAWYDAENVDGADNETLNDGANVLSWFDRSGNGRTLVQDTENSASAPKFILNGLANKPVVRFTPTDGSPSPNTGQSLRSGSNDSRIEEGDAGSQLSSLPGYRGCSFGLVMAIKPRVSTSTANLQAEQRVVFTQANDLGTDGAGTGVFSYTLVTNTVAGNNTPADGDRSPGDIAIRMVAKGEGSGGSVTEVDEGNFDNDPTTVIVSLTIVPEELEGGAGSTLIRGSFRVNGKPVDDFVCHSTATEGQFVLGGNTSDTGFGWFSGDIMELFVVQGLRPSGVDRVWDNELRYPATAFVDTQIGDLQLVEGYMAHKWGNSHLLHNNTATDFPHPYFALDGAGGLHPNSFGTPRPDPANAGGVAGAFGPSPFFEMLCESSQHMVKFAASLQDIRWITQVSGVGHGLALGPREADAKKTGAPNDQVFATDKNVFSIGPKLSPSNVTIRRLDDEGDTVDTTQWTATLQNNADPDFRFPVVGTDAYGNSFFPISSTDAAVTQAGRVYTSGGVLFFSPGDASVFNGHKGRGFLPSVFLPNYAKPQAPNDLVQVSELAFLATDRVSDALPNSLHQLRLVSADANPGERRNFVTLAVAGSDIKRVDAGFPQSIPATVGIGGDGALDSESQYVQAAVLNRKAFIVDGINKVVYDTIENSIRPYESTEPGIVPLRCQLVASWRGAIMLARPADDPSRWFLSARGNPFDFNFKPPVATLTQAVSSTSALALAVPDIINGLIPVNDDLLLFLCDHSIFRLTGDPAAGGQLDRIKDVEGGAFGKAWAKDRNDNVYVFSSVGGVTRVGVDGSIDRISIGRIERRLQDVDLDNFDVRLEYNYREEGLYVFLMPRSQAVQVAEHYFWDQKNDAWYVDKWGEISTTLARQPTASFVLDGDAPADRRLVIGCNDGLVRKIDQDALDDDGVAIDSLVTMGPLYSRTPQNGRMLETRASRLTAVLSDEQDGAQFELFSDDVADRFTRGDTGSGTVGTVLGRPTAVSGRLGPGRNSARPERVVGRYIFARLRNASLNSRWSLESMTLDLEPAGRVRVRA